MTLYQWLRSEHGRRISLSDVHKDDARQATEEANRDGWRIWVSYRENYMEAICELEAERRRRASEQH